MGKGMFTQGVCVLLGRQTTLGELATVLSTFDIRQRRDALGDWEFGGPTLTIAFRPEVNGYVAVDIVDRKWPDSMGNPKSEPMLFGAWSMGHFGPFTYPGSLLRAAQQSWSWSDGTTIPDRHESFIRIRSSYILGAKDDCPVAPDDYEPLAELEFITNVASAVLNIPGAICYFNPNGEVLRDAVGLQESLEFSLSNDLPPLEIWSNVRLFNVNPQWCLMDTVGNGQLDIPDVETCFHKDSYECGDIDNFLRNVTLYLVRNGEVIEDGDTMDGPGDIHWQAHEFENGICDPPRRVLRWMPKDRRRVPLEIKTAGLPKG